MYLPSRTMPLRTSNFELRTSNFELVKTLQYQYSTTYLPPFLPTYTFRIYLGIKEAKDTKSKLDNSRSDMRDRGRDYTESRQRYFYACIIKYR